MNPAYEPLHRAAQMLAGVCDYASTRDGQGFNGGDADFGHAMAIKDDYSPRMVSALKKMLPKYRRQLGDALTDEILAVSVPEPGTTITPAQPPANGARQALAPATAEIGGALDVEKILAWGEPQRIYTRNGECMVRKATPDERFWGVWRERKEDLKALGLSVFKRNDGAFEVTLWPPRDGAARTLPAEDNSTPLPVAVRPDIAKKLLDYQVPAVGRVIAAIEKFGTALDASDTGTGKTYVALAAAKQLGLKAVVMCPKSVRPTWTRCGQHFDTPVFVSNYEQFKLGKTPYCSAAKVPRLRKDGKPVCDKKGDPIIDTIFTWKLAADEVLITDEVHRCGAMSTLNSDLLVAAKDSGAKTMLLSATAADSPLAMRAIGYSLGLFPRVKDYFKWAFGHGVQKGRFGMEFTGGQAAMRRIHSEIFGRGKGNRLRIADIPDFPETKIIPEVVDFDCTAEINGVYADLDEALSHLDEVEAKDRQGIVLTEILRARQRTELLKVPTLVQMAKDAEAEGMSVALFVNFEATLQAICKQLGTDCIISGSQQGPRGEADREANIQRFQRGNYPRLSIININYSAKQVIQAKGRVHRAYSKDEVPQWSDDCSRFIVCNINAGGVGVSLHHLGGRPSIQKIPFAAGTIEEQAADAVERKVNNIELLNNGDILNGLKIRGYDVNELDLKAA